MGGGRVGRAQIDIDADVDKAVKAINGLKTQLSGLEKAFKGVKLDPDSDAFSRIARTKDAIEKLGGATDRNLNFVQRYSTAINQLAFSAARAGHGFANFLPLIARSTTLLANAGVTTGGLRGALDSLQERFRNAGASGGAFSGVLARLGSIGPTAAIGIAAATVALTALGVGIALLAVKLGPLGAEIQAFRERLELAFGKGAEVIQRFASTASESFGLTELAAIKLTGTIGNVFQSFGVGQERAAGFAVALADAALIIQRTSFTTDTYEEVLTKLKGALTGNVEALREYGIAVNEATIRDVAAQHGVKLKKGELDAASKALLAEIFILDQAKEKQDEFGKASESVLTEQQKLSAAFKELKTDIGEGLVPVLGVLVNIGQGVINFMSGFVDAAKAAIGPINELASSFSDLLNLGEIAVTLFGSDSEKAFDKFAESIGAVKDEIGKPVLNPLGNPEDTFRDFRETVNALFEDFTKGKITAEKFFQTLAKGLDISPEEAQRQYRAFFNVIAQESPELEKYRDRLFDTSFAQEKLVEELRKLHENAELSIEDLYKLVDAHKRLAEAIADAARAEKEAEKDLSRAREDAVRKREDAQRNLAEVIEDAVEKEFEARKKVKDVEKKNFRDIRDGERALKKERLDSAKRVDDAERALADARKKRAAAILDALIAAQDAQFKFDTQSFNRAQRELSKAKDSTDVKNAQRKLEEEEIDRKKRIALLEEKLREVRLDAYEALKEAERELGNVIEENFENIEEAQRKLHDVEVQISRSLYDAQQALINARREGAESIAEAETALERLNFQFGTADLTLAAILDKLEHMKNALLSMPQFPTSGEDPSRFGNEGALAHGGLALRGNRYLVGERGPELFIPNQNGQVISNDVLRKLIAAMNGGRGGSGGGNSIVVHEAADPEATAFAVEARMMRGIHN